VHRQVAAGQGVAVAGGQPQDQFDCLARLGAAALRQLAQSPVPDVRLVGVDRRSGRGQSSDMPMGSRPGCTLNTRTPCLPTSRARFSVSLTTAALDTEHADTSGHR
jgi:hypothetical protein